MKTIKKILCSLLLVVGVIFNAPTVSAQAEDVEPFSVLLLGIDSGYEPEGRWEQGRSDTVMIATVDPALNEVNLISLPRDSYVDIPGYGGDKLNHAYAYGGSDLSLQTVNNLFDSDIKYFARVNMGAFVDMVDAVNGVIVTPPNTFSIGLQDFTGEDITYTYNGGEENALDGQAALYYARERKTSGGDFARQGRQRELVEVITKEAVEKDFADEIANMYDKFAAYDQFETNVPLDVVEKLYAQFLDEFPTFNYYQLDATGSSTDAGYYEYIDEGSLAELKSVIK